MYAVDLLIFDLDGTLCDTKDDIALSVNLTLKDIHLPEKRNEEIYGYVGSGVRRLLQQAVGEESGPHFTRAMEVFRNHYLNHLLDRTNLYPGIDTVLNHFGEKKKAVVTNKPQIYADRILSGLHLTRFFDLIIGGDNGHPLKPDPQMLNFVIDQLGIKKSRAVMIGDGLNDISSARSAGIPVCAVGYGLSLSHILKEAEPDWFCDRPEELTCLFG